ncbi:MAG: hypothetical protein EHM62_01720 [Methylococcus sp.]|nr:MAG: hypothetical protein EHM62_01720 [Methylococcus sp.]
MTLKISDIGEYSVVRTDGWSGHDNLAALGYRHHPVATQGDPATTEAHLPMIHIVFGNLDAGLLGCWVATMGSVRSIYRPTSTNWCFDSIADAGPWWLLIAC